MKFLRIHISYIILFFLSLTINLLFLNRKLLPVLYPDSFSYFNVTKEISMGIFPNFSIRTPTYPLYLSIFTPFNNNKVPIYFSTIIGSLGTLLLYWLINQLTAKKKISFLISLFIMADYGIINYQSTILTESIAPTLILFSIYANINLVQKRRSWQTIIVGGIADLLIMFLKPSFLIVPFLLKIYYLFLLHTIPKNRFKNKFRIITINLFLNLSFIILFLTYNYFRSGSFQISQIGTNNLFGQIIRYKYLDRIQPPYDNPPQSVKDVIEIHSQNNKIIDPYDLFPIIQKKEPLKPYIQTISEVNKYILKRNLTHFIFMGILDLPNNFIINRRFYTSINPKIETSQSFMFINHIYESVNGFKFIGLIIASGITIIMFKKQNPKTIILGTIIITSILVVSTGTFLSYAEFARLRQPVDPLLSLLVFLPLFYIKPNDKNTK